MARTPHSNAQRKSGRRLAAELLWARKCAGCDELKVPAISRPNRKKPHTYDHYCYSCM